MSEDNNIKMLDSKRGSPTKLLYVAGALACQKEPIRQVDLAKLVKMPTSTVVDLVKRVNQIYGMDVELYNGYYTVSSWSKLLSKKEMEKFFKGREKTWDMD